MSTVSAQKKILVVDDDKALTTLLVGVLSSKGYQVLVAHDGLDAMVQVRKFVPDMILLDIMMPEINGYDVCNNLKFDEKYKNIPIIILTCREQELGTKIGQLMGIDYIHKPIDIKVLLGKIKNALK